VFVIFAKAKPEAIQKFIGERYKELAQKENKVFFGGRLGEYKYLDMDKVIESAVSLYRKMNDADALRYK
jgi:UDP-galactopyranose mutase